MDFDSSWPLLGWAQYGRTCRLRSGPEISPTIDFQRKPEPTKDMGLKALSLLTRPI